MAAMSIFFIVIIAANARLAAAGSGSVIAWIRATGVICHDIKLNGDYEGSTWLLPPTLTLKYHPLAGSTVSPYIGAGINYVIPFDEDLNGVSDFSIDSSFGWAAQVGVDLKVTENVFLNLDYKYLNVETKAKIGGVKYDLDLNPSAYGIGVGYRF